MVYQQLKDIVSTATAQHAERSIQRRAKAFLSTLDRSKAKWQRGTQEPPEVGTASSLERISAHDQLSHLDVRLEPQARHQNH
jgi:hypothetical protein